MLKNKTMWIFCFGLVLTALVIMPLSAQNIKDLGRPPSALKGMHIVIGQHWAGYNTNKYPPTDQWYGSEYQEKRLEWRKKIQKEFGFTMEEKSIASWEEMPRIAATSIMAGKPAASVFILQANWAMPLYRQSLLYPVGDSRAVNWSGSEKLGIEYNTMIKDLFTFNRKTYAFRIGYGGSQHSQVIFFNKRLFREAGLDPNLPYDLQKNGQWTWDKFIEISKKLTRDINNDGIIDIYAMTADFSKEILNAIVGSNNAEYVAKDPKTGMFINATNTPAFMEALQFAVRLKNEGVMMPKPEGAAWNWFRPMFNDGKVAMYFEWDYVRSDLANMKDDWGMVLPPKGPRAKDYIVFTDDDVMAIPSTFNRNQVDAILWAVQAWETSVDRWQSELYPIFRDIRAIDETMAMIRDPKRQKFKNHILIPGLELGSIAYEMWWYDGEPAQLVESVSQHWNNLILDVNEE